MKINKFYTADEKDKGGNPAPVTKDDVLKELTTIKSALEKNLTEKAEKQDKNFQEKLEAVNASIETLKNAKPEVTAEEFQKVSDELAVTIKAFDLLQTQVKNNNRKSPAQPEDTSLHGQISKALFEKKDEITSESILGKKAIKEQGMKLKAAGDMSVIANISTGVVPNTYRNGLVPQPFEMIHLRNLVSVTPSDTDSYHFFRHATTGEGAITWQGNEYGTKAQFDEDLTEVTVNLDYLAGYVRISRKMLRNFSALQAYLTRFLPEKYYQAEDTKGYQYILANATGTQDATGTDLFSVIIRTIGKQRKARYNVTGMVMDGELWAKLLTYKASTSGEFTAPIGVITLTATGQMLICGIPVYVASWVGADEVILADWNFIEIIQSEALSLGFFEQDGNNVTKNMITARIEASIAFALTDPKAVVVAALESVS